MNSHRFLTGIAGIAAIGTFAVYATGQQPSGPRVNLDQPAPTCSAPVCAAAQVYYPGNQSPSELRKTLDANPTLVPLLMEMATKGDERESKAAGRTLERICKAAIPELIKAINDPDRAYRMEAIWLLTYAAMDETNRNYPLSDVISALMKIARDENEPEELRKIAKGTICQILQFSQGDFSSMRGEGASPAAGD
ncbi:MAG: HEAT repeat domain-containing protein [Schlesneria sp.]